MRGRSHCVAFMLLFSAAVCNARAETDGATPAFTNVPELASGFRSLYIQNFTEAREKFSSWETQPPDQPLGDVDAAARYPLDERRRKNDSYTSETHQHTIAELRYTVNNKQHKKSDLTAVRRRRPG